MDDIKSADSTSARQPWATTRRPRRFCSASLARSSSREGGNNTLNDQSKDLAILFFILLWTLGKLSTVINRCTIKFFMHPIKEYLIKLKNEREEILANAMNRKLKIRVNFKKKGNPSLANQLPLIILFMFNKFHISMLWKKMIQTHKSG